MDAHRESAREVAGGALRGALSRAASGLLRTRWIVRAPIWLYRARLGFLMGPRFLMLEHTGRTSGQPRRVVLEVLARGADTRLVASGFGRRAQWFRNIEADPHVRLYLGGHGPRAALARELGREEAAATLSEYAEAHPKSWAGITPVLERTLQGEIGDLPLVEFALDPR